MAPHKRTHDSVNTNDDYSDEEEHYQIPSKKRRLTDSDDELPSENRLLSDSDEGGHDELPSENRRLSDSVEEEEDDELPSQKQRPSDSEEEEDDEFPSYYRRLSDSDEEKDDELPSEKRRLSGSDEEEDDELPSNYRRLSDSSSVESGSSVPRSISPESSLSDTSIDLHEDQLNDDLSDGLLLNQKFEVDPDEDDVYVGSAEFEPYHGGACDYFSDEDPVWDIIRKGFAENQERYYIWAKDDQCDDSQCIDLLKEIGCESSFIRRSGQVPTLFWAKLDDKQAAALEGVGGIKHLYPESEHFYPE